MKKVIDTARNPPDGHWIYVCPEDKYRVTALSYNATKSKAFNYRKINNYPIGSNWDTDFEQNICENMSPGVCTDWIPPTLAEKMDNLTLSLLNYARSGFKVTEPDKATARLDICIECNYYSGQRGLLKIMCRKCGCSGLKLFMDSSICPLKKW